jgi:hypothetical protein
VHGHDLAQQAPRRMLISDSVSRIRNASRSVGLDTPNISVIAASDGSVSPVVSSPRTIWPRMCDAMSSAVFGARSSWPAGPRYETAVDTQSPARRRD